MTQKYVFVDRRSKNDDRREERDPCREIPMDLYHRKRRKSIERRDLNKSLSDDYYAFIDSKEDHTPKKTVTTAEGTSSRPQLN